MRGAGTCGAGRTIPTRADPMTDRPTTAPPTTRRPLGALAVGGLCVAGMVAGAVWALNPPEVPMGRPKGVPGMGPLPVLYTAPPPPPNLVDRDEPPGRLDDRSPKSAASPAPAPAIGNDPPRR
jgi:hypothetical protein